MTKSLRSSRASATCRLDWRPSRLLRATLVLLGAGGALGVLASGVPSQVAWCLAPAALIGGWLAAAREGGRPVRTILWDGTAGVVRVDGLAVAHPVVSWRGTLACLAWRDATGRSRRLVFWPDVLDARQRRELRLAAGPAAASPATPSMAP